MPKLFTIDYILQLPSKRSRPEEFDTSDDSNKENVPPKKISRLMKEEPTYHPATYHPTHLPSHMLSQSYPPPQFNFENMWNAASPVLFGPNYGMRSHMSCWPHLPAAGSFQQHSSPLINRLVIVNRLPSVANAAGNVRAGTKRTVSDTGWEEQNNEEYEHHERKRWKCEDCEKTFDRPSLLRRHRRVHTGERPYLCRVCLKSFTTSSSLNTHRRIHTGEKPHRCDVCSKRFTASSNLYYHRLTHTTNKPHRCPACPRTFSTPGDLHSHIPTHTGQWTYKCPCGRGFARSYTYRSHLLMHLGYRSHKCPVPETDAVIPEQDSNQSCAKCRIMEKYAHCSIQNLQDAVKELIESRRKT